MGRHPYFIKSAVIEKDYPRHEAVEFAFLGASNSGKSSLVNSLLGKELCKTSSKPGHTALLNFFMVKKGVSFVDLPGYGFAKRSKKEQLKWKNAIECYLARRENLALCFILFDLKRGLLKSDLDLMDWLVSAELPFSLVATKVDKLNQKERAKKLKDLERFSDQFGLIPSSSVKKLGIKQMWAQIDALVENF